MTHALYGSRGSGSAAVEIALGLCGVPFRLVHASSWEPDSALEELGRINPLRQIPTLVLPDGGVLTESAAILIHLGLTHPASGLLPGDVAARASALRGLVFIAANCYAAISVGDYPQRWTTATTAEAQEQVRQAARSQLHNSWTIFADTFGARPFLSGPSLGALDLLAAVVSMWSGSRAHLKQQRADFMTVIHRIEAHPAVTPVFRAHWPKHRTEAGQSES